MSKNEISVDDAIAEAVQVASDLIMLRNLSRRPGLSGLNALLTAKRLRERLSALDRFARRIEDSAQSAMIREEDDLEKV